MPDARPGILPGLILVAAAGLAVACGGVSRTALDPDSRDFYETARLVMTSAEEDIFHHLPDAASRREFIEEFWSKRDPDPDTAVNEFQEEFRRRIDYANKHFNEGRRGINTDRGRVYLYLGPPEKTETFSNADGGFTVWWIYYTHDLGIEFVESRGFGEYSINQVSGSLMDAIETAKLSGFGRVAGDSMRLLAFEARYDAASRRIVVEIPVRKLQFREEGGLLKADFDFVLFVYQRSGEQKDKFEDRRSYEGTAADIERLGVLSFEFDYELPPGRHYLDVIVDGGADNGRIRRIFSVRR